MYSEQISSVENQTVVEHQDIDFHLKANELEKSIALRKGFFRGLLTGVFFTLFSLGIVASGLYINRHRVVKWAVSTYFVDYMREFFAGFPDAYMSHNRERVLLTLDNFTNAVAANTVTTPQFENIARLVFSALDDRRITYQEMGTILDAIDAAAKKWSTMDRERRK